MRAAIRRLTDDDALRDRMRAAARKRAETEFSYDLLAERLSTVAAGDLDALPHLAVT